MEADRRAGTLPGLVCVVAAVLMWWGADTWREDRKTVESQSATAQRLIGRQEQVSASELKVRADQAARRRSELAARLRTDSSLQMSRAEMFYELRQKCQDVKLNCIIRLQDASAVDLGKAKPAAPAASAGGDAGRADALSALGVYRVRATVSSTLANQDITEVIRRFQLDTEHQWRVNRVQLKGRAFELDVERHVIPGKA